jgi:hypothetical protein
MYAALIVLAFQGHGGDLPSQDRHDYRRGCTPANRHCERCRLDGCGSPYYDFRRYFDYPWYPPYHRPVEEGFGDAPYDVGPRIIPLDDPPGWPAVGDMLLEEVPAPRWFLPGTDHSSPSDRPPAGNQ